MRTVLAVLAAVSTFSLLGSAEASPIYFVAIDYDGAAQPGPSEALTGPTPQSLQVASPFSGGASAAPSGLGAGFSGALQLASNDRFETTVAAAFVLDDLILSGPDPTV